jgi:hypothetical protein
MARERVLTHMAISVSRLKSVYHVGMIINREKVMYVLLISFLLLCVCHYLAQKWLKAHC